ncbi:MAG TPA: 50S ribosomal protein L11 methyltransferase [Thermoanaerobaculia bacterium]
MKDFILDISWDAREAHLEELVQSRLFLTASTGSSSVEVNGTVTLSAYFDAPESRDEAARTLSGIEGLELHPVERERANWLELYEQSLEPMSIGERFVVAPDAKLIDASLGRMPIIVPQEQAFGTGSHETTALCIEMLEGLEVRGKRGLDVGAGSGILALAMHRLGAAKAIAFDNDPDAYGALRDNRIRNGVEERDLPLFIGSVEALRAGEFDVVTMNIIPEVIIPLLGDVVARLAGGAHLILSGILIVRGEDVIEAARAHGLRLVRARERGEWWAGVFTAS